MKEKGGVKKDRLGWRPFVIISISVVLLAQLPGISSQSTPTPSEPGQTDSPATTTPTPTRHTVDVKRVRKFVTNYSSTDMSNFTFSQLKQWFESKAIEGTTWSNSTHNETVQHISEFGYPRLFSFCVTSQQIKNASRIDEDKEYTAFNLNVNNKDKWPKHKRNIKYFERIFESIELRSKKFYQFESTLDYQPENKSFIEKIEFSRINTPEPDMINLRQWVHITITAATELQGLYLQSIVGPFGLPFGEFSVEFPCKDFPKSETIDKVGQLEYCSYRPKTNIVHPSVYVGVGEEGKGRKEWHVHFKWFDITCMATPYVQFLMIAVKNLQPSKWKTGKIPKNGEDYVPLLSEIFINTNFDSKDGSPYPYYPEWRNKMYCNLKNDTEYLKAYDRKELSKKDRGDTKHAPINFIPINERTTATGSKNITVKRVQPNEQYDNCILGLPLIDLKLKKSDMTANVSIRNEHRLECGPGPFRCDESYSEDFNETIKRRNEMVNTEVTVSDCVPCGVPECTLLFDIELCDSDLPPVHELYKETEILGNMAKLARGRNHGASASVAFLFFIPLCNYLARFCKDIGGKWVLGNGPWLLFHCFCAITTIVLCCDSAGNIFPNFSEWKAQQEHCIKELNYTQGSPNYEACMEKVAVNTPHNWIGIITLLLLLATICFGFIRPSSNKIRLIMSMLHSHLGYFTWIMGIITICLGMSKNHCAGAYGLVGAAIAIPIVFSVVAVLIDLKEDRRLGIIPGRRQWPVYEQIELEKRGPFEIIKWIVFALFAFCMFVLLVLIVANTYLIANTGDAAFEGVSSTKKAGNAWGKIQGIFGKCTPPDAKSEEIERN